MNEANVVTGGAFANAARREPHALLGQPCDRRGEIIDPQAEMVEARLVNLRRLVGVDRFHQIDLDARERQDVLVDILALAAKRAARRHAEQIDPQRA